MLCKHFKLTTSLPIAASSWREIPAVCWLSNSTATAAGALSQPFITLKLLTPFTGLHKIERIRS